MPVKPAKLLKGNTIGVLTPASPPSRVRLKKGLSYLRGRGFEYRLSPHAYAKNSYLAGSDEDRVNDMHIMFADPQVHAVFASRGGYGSIRMLDRIDYNLIKRYPKVFVGYSDLTAFQLAVYKNCGVVTFAGPMVAADMYKPLSSYSEDLFWRMITSARKGGNQKNPNGEKFTVVNPGKASGILLGGCMSVLCSLLGTPYLPDFSGALLFLEDIGEEMYRIDKFLAQLKHAGILKSISGIIVGKFADCPPRKRKKSEKTVIELFEEYTADLKIPVLGDVSFGHISEKMTIPIGIKASIDTDKRQFSFDEGAVL